MPQQRPSLYSKYACKVHIDVAAAQIWSVSVVVEKPGRNQSRKDASLMFLLISSNIYLVN